MHRYLHMLLVVQLFECLGCMKNHLPLHVAPYKPKGHVTHWTCTCDDVTSDVIKLQDDIMSQLAKMMQEFMMHIKCGTFEGASLTHLHKKHEKQCEITHLST